MYSKLLLLQCMSALQATYITVLHALKYCKLSFIDMHFVQQNLKFTVTDPFKIHLNLFSSRFIPGHTEQNIPYFWTKADFGMTIGTMSIGKCNVSIERI